MIASAGLTHWEQIFIVPLARLERATRGLGNRCSVLTELQG